MNKKNVPKGTLSTSKSCNMESLLATLSEIPYIYTMDSTWRTILNTNVNIYAINFLD